MCAERCQERAIRRDHAEVVPERRDASEDAGHRHPRRSRPATACASRDWSARCRSPAGNASPITLTLVEPSRSAAAVSNAPRLRRLQCASARASSPRSVALEPGFDISSSGGAASISPAASYDRLDSRRFRARLVVPGGSSRIARLAQASGQVPRHRRVALEAAAHDQQRIPRSIPRSTACPAPPWQACESSGQRGNAAVMPSSNGATAPKNAVRAELVPRAVRGAALDAVLPALGRAVHDRGRLAVVDARAPTAAPRGSAGSPSRPARRSRSSRAGRRARAASHCTYSPGDVAVAADAVGVDRGLVPVDVQDRVTERRGARRGHRLGDATGRQAAFAFDDVHARRVARRKCRLPPNARPSDVATPTPDAPVDRRRNGVAGVG